VVVAGAGVELAGGLELGEAGSNGVLMSWNWKAYCMDLPKLEPKIHSKIVFKTSPRKLKMAPKKSVNGSPRLAR